MDYSNLIPLGISFLSLLIVGHITIDQVNKFWRAKVQAKLDEMNVTEGQPE